MKYPITVGGRTMHISAITACTMLELWLERNLVLSEEEYDELQDAVIELLSMARDERFRLVKGEDEEPSP